MGVLKTYESGCQNPQYLVILLHGYGSNGENLIDLAIEFQPIIKDAYYIAPNAIEQWEGRLPNAYQWFSLYKGIEAKSLEEIASNIRNANKLLSNFISDQLCRFNLPPEKLILIGFSQGSMMAIYQSLIMQQKIAGVVSFSGKVIDPKSVGDKVFSNPNICLIHGTHDSVLPYECFIEAQEILKSYNINFDAYSIANLDHAIDKRAINFAKNYLKKITS